MVAQAGRVARAVKVRRAPEAATAGTAHRVAEPFSWVRAVCCVLQVKSTSPPGCERLALTVLRVLLRAGLALQGRLAADKDMEALVVAKAPPRARPFSGDVRRPPIRRCRGGPRRRLGRRWWRGRQGGPWQ